MLREAIRALQSKINSHKSKIEMEPNIIRKVYIIIVCIVFSLRMSVNMFRDVLKNT